MMSYVFIQETIDSKKKKNFYTTNYFTWKISYSCKEMG